MTLRTLRLLAALLLTSPALAVAAPPPEDLEPILQDLAKDPLFTKSDVAVQVVDLRTGEQVFARNADTLLAPASTTKVLTAATSLKTLGPAYRFTTRVTADAAPDALGVVKGNVYVRGGGDPTMVVEKLWKLVADMELAGVQKIDGNLVFDDSFFAPDTSLSGWDKAADVERGPAYFPKLSALSLNFNTASIVVRPGPTAGSDAVVRLETEAGDHIQLVGGVKTGAAGGRRGVRIVREVREDGGMKFTATGSIPLDDETARYYRTIDDPTGHFMAVFADLVKDRGIGLTGELVRDSTASTPASEV